MKNFKISKHRNSFGFKPQNSKENLHQKHEKRKTSKQTWSLEVHLQVYCRLDLIRETRFLKASNQSHTTSLWRISKSPNIETPSGSSLKTPRKIYIKNTKREKLLNKPEAKKFIYKFIVDLIWFEKHASWSPRIKVIFKREESKEWFLFCK